MSGGVDGSLEMNLFLEAKQCEFHKVMSDHEYIFYTGCGSQLEWRETGHLPTPRIGLRAAVIENHIYVTGGYDWYNSFTEILRWDPSTESWQHAGDIAVKRFRHAAVAIPSSIIESECSAMLLK